MQVLADTGILLRLLERTDPQHLAVREALRRIRNRGDTLVTAHQNRAEFWNVCTRPITARGGLGLSVTDAERRLRTAERVFPLLPDSPATYPVWRQLLFSHSIMGVQTHDARLVALMMVHSVYQILTLNPSDFNRYPGITALTPAGVATSSP